MREDVACGLAFLCSVADWAGVAAPTAKGLLALGSAICDTNFNKTGRTLTAMGLAKLTKAEMQTMLENGL
jgi:opine dehydrogenase